ncbi:RT0821/Lpp0805 family surface protein [Candidatus Bandiella euplotis]|uniref:17 kDa outer membrane surface antigen n=1 Tax=Candidatus Bandiella euplotis TaxID=1664265 RepID=A0ABZ0UPE6_9RICK|nr:RT0821/Lpp0805 family surface protein [Candidatus Bandiella woodruffii]WPX96869.1 17 kDa outer membrane surface antigen [Candidatus Bandiella woodruffii]
MKRIIIGLCVVSALSGCYTNEAGQTSKTTMGTIGGGIAGALIGSAIGKGTGNKVAIATGAVLGGLAGNALGRSLDQRDLELQQNAQLKALEYNKSGAPASWNNPDSHASGEVVPVKTFVNDYGQNCREYTQKIKIGNKVEEGFGTACRRADGSWEIVK